jgi:Kef-type K+ transport system membrane component KefB
MAIFLLIAFAVGRLLPRFARRITRLPVSQGLIAFSFVTILIFAWSAEVIGGMAAITGAFVAGLMLARSPLRERIESGIAPIAYGVFVPVFFVNVGLSANVRELTGEGLLLLAALTAAAVIGKVAGAGYGALLSGFSRREALQLGVGMMSRGEVGLIVASVGVAQSAITNSVFSAVVGLVIITTVMTPPSLRAMFKPVAPKAAAVEVESPTGGGKQ